MDVVGPPLCSSVVDSHDDQAARWRRASIMLLPRVIERHCSPNAVSESKSIFGSFVHVSTGYRSAAFSFANLAARTRSQRPRRAAELRTETFGAGGGSGAATGLLAPSRSAPALPMAAHHLFFSVGFGVVGREGRLSIGQ